jgi:uncharacterized membrane protein YbhN (UPF0104 family)
LGAAGTQLACFFLMALDLWSRTVRIRLVLGGAGTAISLRDAFALTSFGDAAAGLTPWRMAGEPARVLGAKQAGVELAPIAATLAAETVMVYGLAAAVGFALAVGYGADWWSALRSSDIGSGLTIGPIVLVVGSLIVLPLLAASGRSGSRLRRVGEWIRSSVAAARRIPGRVLVECCALSVVSLGARLVLLPLIVSALPERPPLGVATLASFTLLHGQIVMPTPSGAGPVELLFLEGGAGVGAGAGRALATWRIYTTVLPVVIGLSVGTIAYGRAVLGVLALGRWRRRNGNGVSV